MQHGDAEKGADHVDLAMGEMNDVETGVDKGDPERDEAIDHAERYADDGQVDEVVQTRSLLRTRP